VATDKRGLVCDAEIDVASRKVESLLIDDERMESTLIALAVLDGCVAAILEEAARRRAAPASLRPATTTTTRPDVPVCEGGCE
jgi:hypothetical protein